MDKKPLLLLPLLFLVCALNAQTFTLKKGIVIDSLPVHDSIPETFSLYLPTDFVTDRTWPVLFAFDLKGTSKKTISMFANVAEKEGYILATSNHLSDSISLSNNMLRTSRMMSAVKRLLPMDNDRVYTAGFSSGGRFANLVPLFIKGITGAISCGASLSNIELLNTKIPFHYIAIVGREDFTYTDALKDKKVLNKLKFENQLLLFDEGKKWPDMQYLQQALQLFKLSKMAKGGIAKDSNYIEKVFRSDVARVRQLVSENKPLMAERAMSDMIAAYRLHKPVDSLKEAKKELRKQKAYKSAKRAENSAFFQESLLREDYQYYLEEDLLTYNFNNLGWWNYQMGELQKFINGDDNTFKQRMGKRVKDYLNALIEDNIDIIKAEKTVDEDALVFLSMLKTITEPTNYNHYLQVISISAKNEDFGTALFYLEELLKKGFKDKERLYNVEHTALFRISPEFNELVSKYLKDSRYDVIED
ncbi:alpha/beta hydrolase [Allomuricauda sp. d1]|uniref:alpha/beta hydrolase n=1 Tax=Allomuricauda sp. d1 TaxID=3136725 RepID=UPI0031E0F3A7